MKYNTVICYVCGSPYHRVKTCPENQRKRNISLTHEVYQQIYNRYEVKASKPSVRFMSLFTRNQQYVNQKGMFQWDSVEKVRESTK